MNTSVQIGRATLYNADCRDILPTLARVDAVVTDPPYGIGDKGGKWGRKAEHHWDSETPSNIEQVLAAADRAIIWGGNYFDLPPSRGWLAWRKPDRVPSAADFELAWTSIDMNARMIDHSIGATNAERVGHPTQKPLRVMKWSIAQLRNPVGQILDPFMGSGTTGVAAVGFGHAFIGIEREERYFMMACERIAQAQRQGDFFVEAA